MMMKRTRTKEMTLTMKTKTKTKMTPSIPITMTKSLLSLNRFAWNPCSRPWTCTTSGAKLCQTSSFKPFLWRLFVRSCPLPKREPFVIWWVIYCDDYWSICFILFLLSWRCDSFTRTMIWCTPLGKCIQCKRTRTTSSTLLLESFATWTSTRTESFLSSNLPLPPLLRLQKQPRRMLPRAPRLQRLPRQPPPLRPLQSPPPQQRQLHPSPRRTPRLQQKKANLQVRKVAAPAASKKVESKIK